MEARFHPYRLLSEKEREAHLARCREFLHERDGEPDVAARTLSRRESRMRDYEQNPVVWDGALDRDTFDRVFCGDRRGSTDARTEFALAAAKSNEGESFGVEIELRRYAKRGLYKGLRAPDVLLTQYMQEAYHCRLLVELCRSCGIDFRPRPPALANRILISIMGLVPASVKWVPGMAGEIVGAAVFGILHSRASLFRERPAVEARLRSILHEIWLDESVHISYLRAQNGRLGLALVRALFPIVAWLLLADMPPLRNLGITMRGLLEWTRSGVPIPSEVAWLEGRGEEPIPDATEIVQGQEASLIG
jgi:hypothetical protein